MADHPAFDPYPVFLDLRSRLVVVVGEGRQAERKARAMLRHGADVVAISSDPPITLVQAESEGLLSLERREFAPGDLAGAFAVFAVHASKDVQQAVYADALANGCLVNVAGAPELSNFGIPSVMRRGPLQIAVSTAGVAPVLAKRVREELKERYAEEWAAYVTLMGELRALLVERVPGEESERRAILEAVADSDVLERIRAGRAPDAEALIAEFVPEHAVAPGADADLDPDPTSEES